MGKTKNLLLAPIVFVVFPAVGGADDSAKRTFERQLFSPAVISASGLDAGRFSAMNREERAAVLSAKETLVEFFRACHTRGADPRKYLAASVAEKYRDAGVLKKALFDPETEVVLLFVSGYSFVHETSVELKYAVVVEAEGNLLVREDRAQLSREAGGWRILSLFGLH